MDYSRITFGPPPDDDPWGVFYRFYYRWVQPIPVFRAFVRRYFLPWPFELWHKAAIYRFLGVAIFGKIIPTGGIVIRRITGLKMVDYTLKRTSLDSARCYLFRTCAIEAAHFVVFLAVSMVVVICCALGKVSLAVGGTVANLVINVYPMMLQRYTRVRIVGILARKLPAQQEEYAA